MKAIITTHKAGQRTYVQKIGFSAATEAGARAAAYRAARDAALRWDTPEDGTFSGGMCVDVAPELQAILDSDDAAESILALESLKLVRGVLTTNKLCPETPADDVHAPASGPTHRFATAEFEANVTAGLKKIAADMPPAGRIGYRSTDE